MVEPEGYDVLNLFLIMIVQWCIRLANPSKNHPARMAIRPRPLPVQCNVGVARQQHPRGHDDTGKQRDGGASCALRWKTFESTFTAKYSLAASCWSKEPRGYPHRISTSHARTRLLPRKLSRSSERDNTWQAAFPCRRRRKEEEAKASSIASTGISSVRLIAGVVLCLFGTSW